MPNEVEKSSDLSNIAKLNGDFRRNFGRFLGAFLYLRSISAARGRFWLWSASASIVGSLALSWIGKHGSSWFPGWLG